MVNYYFNPKLVDAFLHINIAQSVFAAIIILTKKPLSTTDKLLSTWLFFVAGLFTMKLIFINFPDHSEGQWIGQGAVITLSFPPFLYLYVKYLISGKRKVTISDALHFIPFLFFSFFVLLKLLSDPNFIEVIYSENRFSLIFITYGLILLATFIGYGIATIKAIRKYQLNIDNLYSFHNTNVSLRWIWVLVIIFYSYYFLAIISGFIRNLFDININTSNILVPAYTVFIYLVSFKGYKQTKLLHIKQAEKESSGAYKKSGLKEKDAVKYASTITKLMDDERLWLNPEITIKQISIRSKIPQHHITQVLNEQLNKNFYTLINEYRVNEVIRLFKTGKYKSWSITAIAFEAGFNSKSSFNNFFKKQTGKTPSDFRKQQSL